MCGGEIGRFLDFSKRASNDAFDAGNPFQNPHQIDTNLRNFAGTVAPFYNHMANKGGLQGKIMNHPGAAAAVVAAAIFGGEWLAGAEGAGGSGAGAGAAGDAAAAGAGGDAVGAGGGSAAAGTSASAGGAAAGAGGTAAGAGAGSSVWGTIGKSAAQAAASYAVQAATAPKPPKTTAPIGMPDQQAEQEAQRRALIEQISRRGRTSTILTSPGDSGSGSLGG